MASSSSEAGPNPSPAAAAAAPTASLTLQAYEALYAHRAKNLPVTEVNNVSASAHSRAFKDKVMHEEPFVTQWDGDSTPGVPRPYPTHTTIRCMYAGCGRPIPGAPLVEFVKDSDGRITIRRNWCSVACGLLFADECDTNRVAVGVLRAAQWLGIVDTSTPRARPPAHPPVIRVPDDKQDVLFMPTLSAVRLVRVSDPGPKPPRLVDSLLPCDRGQGLPEGDGECEHCLTTIAWQDSFTAWLHAPSTQRAFQDAVVRSVIPCASTGQRHIALPPTVLLCRQVCAVSYLVERGMMVTLSHLRYLIPSELRVPLNQACEREALLPWGGLLRPALLHNQHWTIKFMTDMYMPPHLENDVYQAANAGSEHPKSSVTQMFAENDGSPYGLQQRLHDPSIKPRVPPNARGVYHQYWEQRRAGVSHGKVDVTIPQATQNNKRGVVKRNNDKT